MTSDSLNFFFFQTKSPQNAFFSLNFYLFYPRAHIALKNSQKAANKQSCSQKCSSEPEPAIIIYCACDQAILSVRTSQRLRCCIASGNPCCTPFLLHWQSQHWSSIQLKPTQSQSNFSLSIHSSTYPRNILFCISVSLYLTLIIHGNAFQT